MSTKSKTRTGELAITLKGIQTLFGDVVEKKVVFCIDTSGSSYELLPAVKEHLVETLLKMAYQEKNCSFNLVSFCSEVSQWADKMVPCTPDVVAIACKWIRLMEATTGTNTLNALLCAFENDCDAVYLVTDGYPDQEPQAIYDHISYIGRGRPIHCIYVAQGNPDKRTWDFLEELANETFGSFHVVSFTRHGCMDRVTPVHRRNFPAERIIRTNDGGVYPNLSNCSVTTCLTGDPLEDPVFVAPNFVENPKTGEPHPYYHPKNHWYWWGAPVPGAYGPFLYNPFYSWSRYRPSRAFIYGRHKLAGVEDKNELSPTGSALLIGRRVLARHIPSGEYYEGKVKSQIFTHQFLVEFSPKKGDKFDSTDYQDTSVADIIAFDDAFRHPILPGDRAFAPEDLDNPTRYVLVTVMEGSERRGEKVPPDEAPLTVQRLDGKMQTLPAGRALWIPNSMFHRLSLEAKMPAEARERLRSTPGYPFVSLAGYPTAPGAREPEDFERVRPDFREGLHLQVDHLLPPYYLPVHPLYETFGLSGPLGEKALRQYDDDRQVQGTDLTVRALTEKVDRQIQELQNNAPPRRAVVRVSELSPVDASQVTVTGGSELPADGASGAEETEREEKEKKNTEEPPPTRARPASAPRQRPPWRHFANDSIPDLIDPPSREPLAGARGPAGSMEMRGIRHIGGAAEWSDSSFAVADRNRSQYDREALLAALGEPSAGPGRRRAAGGPLGDVGSRIGAHEADRQRRELEADAARRRRGLDREDARRTVLAERLAQEARAEDARRERASAHLERLRTKQEEDAAAVVRQREHKRQVLEGIRARQERPQDKENPDVRRVELIRQRREERESAAQALDERVRANRRRLEELHQQRDAARWEGVHNRLMAEERRTREQDLLAREAERSRRADFRLREETRQRQHEMEAFATRQNAPPLA